MFGLQLVCEYRDWLNIIRRCGAYGIVVATPCVTYAVESQAPLGPLKSRQAAIFTAFWRQLYAWPSISSQR